MTRFRSSPFSPHAVAAEDLERLFVGRHAALVEVVEDFAATAEAGGARFEALHGPRGAGKSHFVAVAAHRLAARIAPVGGIVLRLDEEECPANFTDFISRLIRRLPPSEDGPTPEAQVTNLRALPAAGREERAMEMLRAVVGDRPAVLVLENLDRILEAIGASGQLRLRRTLGDARRWSVLATTCTWPRALESADAPFFQQFTKRALPPFTDGDAVDMLLHLSRQHGNRRLEETLITAAGRTRVRAIRLLLGDKPRAMALIFRYLQTGALDELEESFTALSEELTPYFQDQMSRLAPGKRVYMEQLATNWVPLSVRELAERVFDTQQTASGQLRYLADDHLVQCVRVGRESFYELADPLHRLAAAMKHPEHSPACLARFLVSWLGRGEVERIWIETGSRSDPADPWFLASRVSDEDVSAFEQRTVERAEALIAKGKAPDGLARLRACFEERRSVHVGAHWVAETANAAPEDFGTVAQATLAEAPSAMIASTVLLFADAPRVTQPPPAVMRRAAELSLAAARDGDAWAGATLVAWSGSNEAEERAALDCLIARGTIDAWDFRHVLRSRKVHAIGALAPLVDPARLDEGSVGMALSLGATWSIEDCVRGRDEPARSDLRLRWLLRHGEPEDALAAARDYHARFPGSEEATVALFAALAKSDPAHPELVEVAAAMTTARHLPPVAARLAHCHLSWGRVDVALATLREAIPSHPDDPELRGAEVVALAAAGRWEEARESAAFLERADPTLAAALALGRDEAAAIPEVPSALGAQVVELVVVHDAVTRDPSVVTHAWAQRLAAHPDAQLRLALVFGAALGVHPGAVALRSRFIALAEAGMFGQLGGACLLAVAALPDNPVPFRRLPAEARATLRVQLDTAPTRHLLATVASD